MEFEGPTCRLIAYPCSENNAFNMSAFISVGPSKSADRNEGKWLDPSLLSLV